MICPFCRAMPTRVVRTFQQLQVYRQRRCPKCGSRWQTVERPEDSVARSKNKGAKITLALRFAVLKRDGFKCRYCGVKASDAELQIDHVISRAMGGKTEIDNLAASCAACNMGKGTGDGRSAK